MKNTWVLSIKTSLPKVYYTPLDLKTSITAFESFEDARDALRSILKKYAFSKNRLFDGKGNIIWLSEEIKLRKECEDENGTDNELEDDLTASRLESVRVLLQDAFNGKDVVLKQFKWDSGLMICTGKNGGVKIYGYDDGSCPVLKTNIFSMEKEKDYYLYVAEDYVNTDDAPAVLMIDLVKAEEFTE